MKYERICWLSSVLTTELFITALQYPIIIRSWWFCWKMINDKTELLLSSICYSATSPMLHAAALLPSLCKHWWMCCDNRQRHRACASSPNSSWQQPWSSCRIDRDSRRHTDLFSVVSLNTLSCATHNADTNRKSLSVCLKSEMVKMFWASVTITPACISAPHWWVQQSAALVVSVRCVYKEPGEKCHLPIGRHAFLTVYNILWHLHT